MSHFHICHIPMFFPRFPPSISPPDNLSSLQSGYHDPSTNDASYTLHDCQTSKQNCHRKRETTLHFNYSHYSQRLINISPCAKSILQPIHLTFCKPSFKSSNRQTKVNTARPCKHFEALLWQLPIPPASVAECCCNIGNIMKYLDKS